MVLDGSDLTEFRVLGPLEVVVAGRRVPVGGAKQRLLVAALLSGLATYAALTGSFGALQDRATLLLVLIDLIVLLLLGTALARRLVALWLERRKGLAGARLHADQPDGEHHDPARRPGRAPSRQHL